MKLVSIKLADNNIETFKGTRTLKNTVSQLAKNNKYSLNEPNQRNITNSINELGKTSGEKTVKFLLDIASRLKYATNIKLKDKPINNWKEMLLNAAAGALAITPFLNKTDFTKKIEELRNINSLNTTEENILKLRSDLLKVVDINQIKNETEDGIKDFERNLDYFIVSSETTLEHKKYVLKKLNYLMSDKYQINPQLKDKKSIVAAELINDMAICTPGHEVPNIKAVSQNQHGICGAISIVRKKIAYEDKPNYIDSILSELDATDQIVVYDRNSLGSGKKTVLNKVPVDFDAAIAKGYRIIDASSAMWMQIAHKSGYSGRALNNYIPFDEENFDINVDSFFNAEFEDFELKNLQAYYQALLKAEDTINSYKAKRIKTKTINIDKKHDFRSNVKAAKDVKSRLNSILGTILPESAKTGLNTLTNGLFDLRANASYDISDTDKFNYIENEEESSKKRKIREFLVQNEIPLTSLGDDVIDRIYDLTESYHSFRDDTKLSKIKKYSVNNARSLYEIAAGIRYQFVKGFENEAPLNYMMKDAQIPNLEDCIIATADKLIEKLKNNSADSGLIIDSLAKNSGKKIKTQKGAIRFLNDIKHEMKEITSSGIDDIYKSIDLQDRTGAIIDYIDNIKSSMYYNPDETLCEFISGSLGVENSPNKLIRALENIKNGLLNGKLTYNDVFNKLGSSSQIIFLNNIVNAYVHELSHGDDREAVERFIAINHLDINNLSESIGAVLDAIENNMIMMADLVEYSAQVLKITDNEGNVLYSPYPADILIKRMENSNSITPISVLKELQSHMDKVQKDRATNEFDRPRGKLKDKSLYKFSKTEKNAIDAIERNTIPLSRYINKQLSYVEKYIKVPLEELKRMIGVNMGHWWVGKEGTSGLTSGESIRILEYITGRPHHTTSNILRAIERIKTTPYSGISSSFVYHNQSGSHAQYIADIQPIKLKVSDNGKIETKTEDVLFQDNSWGAIEHENTWVDSTGLTRTDYNGNMGGTLGYITNEKYRNGNLVSRVIGPMILDEQPEIINNRQYKKIRKGDLEGYKSPQYTKIAIDGKSPDVKELATSIYDAVFTPTSDLMKRMKKFAENMTYEEINSRLNRLKNPNLRWKTVSDRLINRMTNEEYNPVQTQEEYENLADTDILKITLEKAALIGNYPLDDIRSKLVNIKDVKELEHFRTLQRQRALKEFEYSFGKNINIVDFLADNVTEEDLDTLKAIIKKYGIEMTDEEIDNILYSDIAIENDEFDGSIKNTINIFVDKVYKNFADKITNDSIHDEFTEVLRQIFADKLYFNKSDIDNLEIQHIIKFIDRVYNPADDNELVRIYRDLQNMTKEEFKNNVEPYLTNTDLNIKEETGYSLLKRVQRYESSAENKIINTVYADEINDNIQKSKPYNEYTNYKLNRTVKTLAKYTFDTAYREMSHDLSMLTLAKSFDKYKDANIDKYDAYPAYPKVDYMSDSMFDILIESLIEPIEETVEHLVIPNKLHNFYKLSDELQEFSKNLNDDYILDEKEYSKLHNILGKILELSSVDEIDSKIQKASDKAVKIPHGEKIKAYKKYFKTIMKGIDSYKKEAPPEAIEDEIKYSKETLERKSKAMTEVYIRTRYQNKFYKTLQMYKQSLIKQKTDTSGYPLADFYRIKLINELKNYITLQVPEEALDRYVQSLAVDSPLAKYSSSLEGVMTRAFGFAKMCEIQSILMSALEKGIETDVKSYFDKINIQLKDGTNIPMSSATMIAHIVRGLIIDKQDETALLFLDKLGLNETYVKYEADNFDFDELKGMISDTSKKHKGYTKFTDTFNKQYEYINQEIQNGKNPERLINNLKKILTQSAKDNEIEKVHLNIFLAGIDQCKKIWRENPDIDKGEIFSAIIYEAAKIYQDGVSNYFQPINDILESQETVIKLVDKIPLYNDSEAAKIREEMDKKFIELVKYSEEQLSDLQVEE